jgi:hypothetical protein
MAFVLPLSTHSGGRKTLSLRGIWRAPHWRDRINEIEDAIRNENRLETVEASDLDDADRIKVFRAVLDNSRVKVIKVLDGPVDSDTMARLLGTETLQQVTFYDVRFKNTEDAARVIQNYGKNIKYLSFHWVDGGELANAVASSLRFHSTWKTLRLFMPSSMESAQAPLSHWSIHLNGPPDHTPKNLPLDVSLIDDMSTTGRGWLGSYGLNYVNA